MKKKQIIESDLAKTSKNPKYQPKRLRVSSPSSISRNLSIKKSFTEAVEKQTNDKIPIVKSENEESDYLTSSCSDSGSSSSPSREKEKLERFRNFWSGCNDVFEDEEIDIKEELNCVDIEGLVVEEINNREKFDKIA